MIVGADLHLVDSRTSWVRLSYLMLVSVIVRLLICAPDGRVFGMLVSRVIGKSRAHGKDPNPETMLWWALIDRPLPLLSLFYMVCSSYRSVLYRSPIVRYNPKTCSCNVCYFIHKCGFLGA